MAIVLLTSNLIGSGGLHAHIGGTPLCGVSSLDLGLSSAPELGPFSLAGEGNGEMSADGEGKSYNTGRKSPAEGGAKVIGKVNVERGTIGVPRCNSTIAPDQPNRE